MSDSRPTTIKASVRKRDGAIEPFAKSKIADCLQAVLATSGEGSKDVASDLADAVSAFVAATRREHPYRSSQVAALLRRVLQETGHPRAAELLGQHARERDRMRRSVSVLAWKASVGRIVPRRWNKTVLTNRLQKEFDLEYVVARMIAARVERTVLTLDMRHVTGGLVRELASNELMAWGLVSEPVTVR
jgi:hypothetical protein